MKIAIITGGSKGIGASLVNTFCKEGFKVISISRSLSGNSDQNLTQIQFDLSQVEKIDELFTLIKNDIKEDVTYLVLINNAGLLGEISALENCSSESINKTIQVNLIAPMLLSSKFLAMYKNHKLRIVNISSGAGVNSYYGWAGYCASKSGIESITKTIALEQKDNEKFKILSIMPGVVDTDMQVQIRKADKKDFIHLDRFIELHKNNELFDADFVAYKIYSIFKEDTFVSGSTIDIRTT